MKTLILNGSPRRNGDTAALLAALKSELHGEVIEISAYHDKVSPCVDCRYCYEHPECSIKDDMQPVYDDDFDNIIIASPVYFGTLTGPLLSLASRLQIHFSANHIRKQPIVLRPKHGALILTGGGKGNPAAAIRHAGVVMRMVKAEFDVNADGYFASSFNTDEVPACGDEFALDAVRAIAQRLNG